MSTPHDVLKRAQAAGVAVMVDGGQLRLKAKAEPPRELIEEIRAHKPALLQLLATAAPLDLDGIVGRIEAWLKAMGRLPKACGIEAQTLKALTTDFAVSPWAAETVRLGWTDGDLFALGGLIPEMARRPLHFRAIGTDAISLINGKGHYENWPRPNAENAIPWWRDRCITRLH